MEDLCTVNNLELLITKPAYYKNHKNMAAIGLTLTNSPNCFQDNTLFDSGISDFYLLVAI